MTEKMNSFNSQFNKDSSKLVQQYVASIPFDQRLYRQDIEGSIAHARMLAKQEIIDGSEAETIIRGLNSILQEIEQGKFQFKTEMEDIHMNIESTLFEKIGDVAGKLHTARFRNDQIALDLRLFIKEEIRNNHPFEKVYLGYLFLPLKPPEHKKELCLKCKSFWVFIEVG